MAQRICPVMKLPGSTLIPCRNHTPPISISKTPRTFRAIFICSSDCGNNSLTLATLMPSTVSVDIYPVAETQKRPRRSILIAARLLSLLIGVAGAEGVLWFGGYPNWWQTLHISRDDSEYAPDPDLGWKNRQGQFDRVDPARNSPFRYTNWSQGRRATADNEPTQDS